MLVGLEAPIVAIDSANHETRLEVPPPATVYKNQPEQAQKPEHAGFGNDRDTTRHPGVTGNPAGIPIVTYRWAPCDDIAGWKRIGGEVRNRFQRRII